MNVTERFWKNTDAIIMAFASCDRPKKEEFTLHILSHNIEHILNAFIVKSIVSNTIIYGPVKRCCCKRNFWRKCIVNRGTWGESPHQSYLKNDNTYVKMFSMVMFLIKSASFGLLSYHFSFTQWCSIKTNAFLENLILFFRFVLDQLWPIYFSPNESWEVLLFS